MRHPSMSMVGCDRVTHGPEKAWIVHRCARNKGQKRAEKFGYAWVSADDQDPDLQLPTLRPRATLLD